jgi:hypothetical protein
VVTAEVSSYGAVLAVHIVAVLAAYGAPVTYPLLLPYLRRHHPEALPGVHDTQYWLNTRVSAPASVAIVAAGAYMAFEYDLWSQAWLLVGFTLFAIISLVGVLVIVPSTRQLAALAQGGEATAHEYEVVYRRYICVEAILGVLVAIAVLLMAAKPF